jgi:hypothetical protein
MTIKNAKFTLTRNDAANILDVSTRTLDRYIRGKKLSARKKGGAILLSEEEINNFKVSKFQNMHGASPKTEDRAHRHVDGTQGERIQKILDADTGVIEEKVVEAKAEVATKAIAKKGAREEVFEELYDLSRREIREYHNKLEASNYRLGQIETQLKHSVPLLDYQEQSDALKDKEMIVTGKVKRQEEALTMLEQEVKNERTNKNVYIGLLFGVLALQPLLWLLLQG